MLNETEKKIMKNQFLEMIANAGEINPDIASTENRLSKEFRKLEEQLGKEFISGEITDIIADYREVWETYIYNLVNSLRDCFECIKEK